MSDPAQVLKPVMEDAPREILDLAEAIASLPLEYRLRVEPLVNRVLDNAKRRRRILSLGPRRAGPIAAGHEVPHV